MARTNLKVLRIKNHLSQSEIAERLGCMRSTYSAIESGARSGKQDFWSKLQKEFNVPEEEMWSLMQDETK